MNNCIFLIYLKNNNTLLLMLPPNLPLELCHNLFIRSHLCPSLPPSDNIPSVALLGNMPQYGVRSLSEPHGPRHGLDARVDAQCSPADPWESHRPGSHGQRHLRTKACAHRQAGGMRHARSCCVSMLGTMTGKC